MRLSLPSLAGLAAVTMLAGCDKKEPPPATGTAPAATNASSSPLTAPVDYLDAINKGQRSAVKTIDTASVNSAIQLSHVENGRYPRDLNELVEEKFLPRLPETPSGTKFSYDAQSGKVSVVPK